MNKKAYYKFMGLDKRAIDYGPQSNTIKSTLQDIVAGASLPVTIPKSIYTAIKNRGKGGAPMDAPSWAERLWARVINPHEYVRQDIYYNPKRQQKLLRGFDPHPASTSGVNYSKVDSIRDYLKKSIKGGLNPAAADQLQLGKMFGPKDKGLHKVVGKPNTAIKSYIDTARVAHRGDLARQMLAIRNSKKNKPGMWDILFNRWSWDE